MGDIGEKVKKGPHKGEDKYLHNIHKHTIPFLDPIEQTINFEEKDDAFSVFTNRSF